MKRRKFVRSLLAAPVAPAIVKAGQTTTPGNNAPQQQPTPTPNTPARQEPRQPVSGVPKLSVTEIDLAGAPAPHYFNASQIDTLRKLGDLLMPPLKGNPGAREAGAPEFLDFLLSVSPGDRQQLYTTGLDVQARQKYAKAFCDLDAPQSDAILKPLLVARPWPEDLPKDPMQNFIAQAHEDLRNATQNSREWAEAAQKSGHHFSRRSRSSGYYWAPVDPIVAS